MTDIRAGSGSHESLVGEDLGKDIVTEGISASREALASDRLGRDVFADATGATREAVTAEQLRRDIHADVTFSIRETLISESGIHAAIAIRETLISEIESEETQHYAAQLTSYTVQQNEYPTPGDFRSPIVTASTVQLTISSKPLDVLLTPLMASQLIMEAAFKRTMTAAGDVWSHIDVPQTISMAIVSRGIPYEPVSAAMVKTVRTQVVQDRTLPTHISPVQVGKLSIQAVRKANVGFPVTGRWVNQLIWQAVTTKTFVTPYTPPRFGRIAQLTVRQRSVVAPETSVFAAKVIWQTVSDSIKPKPQSADRLNQLTQLTTVFRLTEDPTAMLAIRVNQLMELVTRKKSVIIPSGPVQVGKVNVSYAQHRILPPPSEVVDPDAGAHVNQVVRLSVALRAVSPPSPISFNGLYRQLNTLAAQLRVTLPPGDVIDPTVGHHTALNTQLAVQARDVIPPGGFDPWRVDHVGIAVIMGDSEWPDPTVSQSYVLTATTAAITVLGDTTFLDPELLGSPAVVPAVGEVVALGDDNWIDPLEPQSAIQSYTSGQVVVLGDSEFIDPTIPQAIVNLTTAGEVVVLGSTDWIDPTDPQSSINLQTAGQAVAMGAQYDDPTIPQSFAIVPVAGETLALGDTTFTDPTIPYSTVVTFTNGTCVVLGDTTLAGQFPLEPVNTLLVNQVIAMSDATMLRMPSREKRTRPVITIQIT